MGLSITSKNKSIDIPYFAFYRLRLVVAKCTDERLGHLYEMIRDANTEEELREHDILINVYYENAPDNIWKIIRFLYMPDSDGKIGKRMCKVIYEKIENYTDNAVYGYAGWENPARFSDFKDVIKDGAQNNGIRWH